MDNIFELAKEVLGYTVATPQAPKPPDLLQSRAAQNVLDTYSRTLEEEVLRDEGQEALTRLQHAKAVVKAWKKNAELPTPAYYVDSLGVIRFLPNVEDSVYCEIFVEDSQESA